MHKGRLMLKWLVSLDMFVPALLLAIFVASLFPEPAEYRGLFSLHTVGDIGVTLIFLFYGLKLNLASLRQDLSNWHLHLLVQTATFVIFPLLVWPFYHIFKDGVHGLLWFGGFFLAALPSTVSSSVVMVSIAKGNIPGAIFNATVSSLAGIVITPLWMSMVINTGQADASEFGPIIVKLLLQVLLPVIVGVALNKYLGRLAQKNSAFLRLFDQAIILLIVYLSFAESFIQKFFAGIGFGDLAMIIVLTVVLFFLVFAIIFFISKGLHFNREDTITAVFSGSKKSLVHGTVMAGIIFQGISGLGVILLPLMIYHALQLVFCGIIARRFALGVE